MRQFFIRPWLGLMFLFFISTSQAQYLEKLRSDRPGQAISPFVPGRNVFQLESGFGFNRGTSKMPEPDISSLFNSTFFRWGLLNNFEVNTTFELRRDNINFRDTLRYINSGLSNLQVGSKFQIINGTKFSPTIAFQASVLLNFLSNPYNPQNIAPSFVVIVDQKINEKTSLLTNLGIDWDGDNGNAMGKYALSLNLSINDKLDFMLENYGTLSAGNFNTYFDSGLSYYVGNDFQVDFSVGYDYNDKATGIFLATGFSWRFMGERYYYQEYAQ